MTEVKETKAQRAERRNQLYDVGQRRSIFRVPGVVTKPPFGRPKGVSSQDESQQSTVESAVGRSRSGSLGAELDVFEHEIALKQQGKIEDRVFAETRLRRGAYGQRYDNGQRHDGKTTRTLNYPSANTKGPNTLWDAPGMQRIKIPFGGLNARPTRNAGRSLRGILGRHRPHHHAPGRSASLHSHRGHARVDAALWPRLASPPAKPAEIRCAT